MKFLVGTKSQVDHDNALIKHIAASWWVTQGYTIIETEEHGLAIVGKNSATGENDPDSLTVSWAIPEEQEDGLWKIPSPSSDQRFYLWRDYIPEGIDIQCEEIEFEETQIGQE